MKSPQDGINLLHSCLRARMADNINDPGMSTARNHHQSLVAHMDDQSLVVIHPRVWLPGAIDLGLLNLKSLFKLRGAFNLSGDQDRPVDQKRWTSLDQ